ncbi:MAG: glycosyltransferase [Firmicutes bacterium]|nr:glycosyltransferase [Bacillota bacterium]
MKIALFTDTFPTEINGVSVSVGLHQKVLMNQGHEVLVITTNPFGKDTTIQAGMIRVPGVELKKLYGYRMSSFFNAKAFQFIRKWNPDVMHIHTDAGIGIFGKISAFFLKRPTVVTYHTMYEDYTHYAGFLKGLASRVVKQFSRSIAEQCTEFISPSIKTKEKIRSYGVDRYINIVPTGIDFSRFESNNLDQVKLNKFRSQWTKPGEKIVLSLGRVAKEKSMDVIIKGFSQYLKTPHPLTKLLIVGDGPDCRDLMQLVSELKLENDIQFVGAVPIQEVPYYYQLADVFASASLTETQGLTFMEAMVSQKIVLCRYDENLASLIRHQQTGFIFADTDDFSRQLHAIFSLEPSKKNVMLSQIEEAVKPYALTTFYENLLEVYQRAIRQYW